MKLSYKFYSWGQQPDKVGLDIEDAVNLACLNTSYVDNEAERALCATQNTADLIGRLMTELHIANVLSDEAVLRVLGSQFTSMVD